MNISKKEKYLLIIVGALGISVLYYTFVYSNQIKKLDEIKTEKVKLKDEYDREMNEVKTLDNRKSSMKSLYEKLSSGTGGYYPTISQEKLIIELDKLLQENGLKGDITFNREKSTSVEKMEAPDNGGYKDSLELSSDFYNDKMDSDEKSKLEDKAKNNQQKDNSSSTNSDKKENTNALSKQMKLTIKFNGSYGALKSFLLSLEKYDKKIVVPTIKVNSKSETDITGEMQLEFYGISPLNDATEDYLKWTIVNVYGKEIPFSKASATGAYSNTLEEQGKKEDKNDFVMNLRAPSSDLPILTIGKANDETRLSYLYSDIEGIEDVTIELKEEDGKFYYKYKTPKDYYPKDDDSLGKEFTPSSDNILIDILSEQRMGTSDVSGVNLKIINNTSKEVNITIRNDDPTKPRVNTTSEGKSVNVTKK
jgi:type IV pilus assembly protein PilO